MLSAMQMALTSKDFSEYRNDLLGTKFLAKQFKIIGLPHHQPEAFIVNCEAFVRSNSLSAKTLNAKTELPTRFLTIGMLVTLIRQDMVGIYE